MQLGGLLRVLLNKLQGPLIKLAMTHDKKYCHHYTLTNLHNIYRVEFRDRKRIYWDRSRSSRKSTQEKGITLMVSNEEIKDILKIIKSFEVAGVLIKCEN